ncbi:MAG TPA: flagellar motor switch phosphatase FliY [Desulfotomaculum sp.]|nr:MAG: CheC, inhibitor of MCP methylation / FliN fusion protein [Desulfotomaculum sp. 46_80]HAG11570.1 flagellar motor switch phosphatase FliY [Desulfotomaculum sp.]HBY03726.1 flagellar motor switch phosphatase FliY [Desulfotomaculum sp.]
MANSILNQDEIDALLGDQNSRQNEDPLTEDLTEQEKDALGEIGNISLGAAATALSQLFNQKVNITSPRITICRAEELRNFFVTPCLAVDIEFIEGLSGFNVLVLKQSDAVIMTDLMMGGEGKRTLSEDEPMSEMEISAAAEAMNQMIGTAATSMADLFGFAVNISPPRTEFLEENSFSEVLNRSQGKMVVIYFRLIIGNILDTKFVQVMEINTAKKQASILYKKYNQEDTEEDIHNEELSEQVEEDLQEGQQEELFILAEEMKKSVPNSTQAGIKKRMDLILDIPLKVTVVLGTAKRPIKDVLSITPGSIVELASLVDEPVEVLVNETLVAKGEVVVVDENFGVRITNIISPEERIKYLAR